MTPIPKETYQTDNRQGTVTQITIKQIYKLLDNEFDNTIQYFFNPSRSNPGRTEKIKLNFYFHTSLWYLKTFYEGLYEAPQKSVKIKI